MDFPPLPIYDILEELHFALERHNTVLLHAPPGAGKSTILPIELLKSSWLKNKKIILLEPRKLAVKAIAQRLSDLCSEPLGKTIGYAIRFERIITEDTKIEVLTEGMLTRRLQSDNALEDVGLIIFDEFHERSLHTDLALVLSRESQQVFRNDLRILVMSATLDINQLSKNFNNAPVIISSGRQHPVKVEYLGDAPSLKIHERMAKAIQKAIRETQGDILAFLPGTAEIHKTIQELNDTLDQHTLLPLYGNLSIEEQQKAIRPLDNNQRKIVLSTSIAETSLTIAGIKVVIDSGYSRVPKYDIKTGLTRLETIQSSLDIIEQRTGRAGRLEAGACFRLWSENTHRSLQAYRTPEILDADLSSALLELTQWDSKEINRFNWVTLPNKSSVTVAESLLEHLGCIENKRITAKGKSILQFPTHPRIANLLLEGKNINDASLASDIAAILEEKNPLDKSLGTDIYFRLEALKKWRAKTHVHADTSTLTRIEKLASLWRKQLQSPMDNTLDFQKNLGKLIIAAYPERVAKQKEDDKTRYKLGNGKIVRIDEYDNLIKEKYLAIAHLDAGQNEGKIHLAAGIDPKQLIEYIQEKHVSYWDYQKEVFINGIETRLGEIIIDVKPSELVDEAQKIKILNEVILKEGIQLFELSSELEQWRNRLYQIQAWYPEEQWQIFSNEQIAKNVHQFLNPYLSSIKKKEDFRKLNLLEIIKTQFTWEELQKINELAPEQIKVPSGFEVKIQYQNNGNNPILAVRLQELFGLEETPRINKGKSPLLLHLLSPGYKPVQITQDLSSFWRVAYPEVRKQLKIRYPKHYWPENPWTAEAIRGIKKK
ncbi:MAG: ATP-dependent helicase HrpB [Cytophagales bacterium]|nr:MAG: ATP-dependent helicase HrpB [Cytophagales bacterium]